MSGELELGFLNAPAETTRAHVPKGRRSKPCGACQVHIFFIKSKAGRQTPVEACRHHWLRRGDGPVKGLTADGEVVRGWSVLEGFHDVEVWETHFAYCTRADDFRRAKRNDGGKSWLG